MVYYENAISFRKTLHYLIPGVFIVINLSTCTSGKKNSESVARQYCGSCHAFPEASLLDKKTWATGVLPEMGRRMGVAKFQKRNLFNEETPKITPILSDEDWSSIESYYRTNAPEVLGSESQTNSDSIRMFRPRPIVLPLSSNGLITLLQADTKSKRLFIGNRFGRLYTADHHFTLQDSLSAHSAMSHVVFQEHRALLLSMGIMDPNDKPAGRLSSRDKSGRMSDLIDSLVRPVYLELHDLNNDGDDEMIICSFGNESGSLDIFSRDPVDSAFRRITLSTLPGTRKTIVTDLNSDALPDILALITQANEQLVWFENQGKLSFKKHTLIEWPPSYGTSYFELLDYNGDGNQDLLTAHGDNADYSPILKPYHGVRIYLGNEKLQFREDQFLAVNGATKAIARDFDQDGDMDIAVISFFTDFNLTPQNSFILFENTPAGWRRQTTVHAVKGRWMVMECADIGDDGDLDLILGSMTFPAFVPEKLFHQWISEKHSLLFLENVLQE